MHDIKDIRRNPDAYRESQLKRGLGPGIIDEALQIDTELRALKASQQETQHIANRANREIAGLVTGHKRLRALMLRLAQAQVKSLEKEIAAADARLAEIDRIQLEMLAPFEDAINDVVNELKRQEA